MEMRFGKAEATKKLYLADYLTITNTIVLKPRLALWVFFGYIGLAVRAYSQPVLTLQDSPIRYSLREQVSILEAPTQQMSIADVERAWQAGAFEPHTQKAFNFGSSSSDFWLRFSISNLSRSSRLVWLLQLNDPLLDHADLYIGRPAGGFSIQHNGDTRPYESRSIKERYLLFRLDSLPPTASTLYLHVRGVGARHFTLTVWNETDYLRSVASEDLIIGVFVGMLCVIMVYNLFLYFFLKDQAFLYYVPYLGLTILTNVSIAGWASSTFFPSLPWLANITPNVLIGLSTVSGTLFVRSFLNIRHTAPQLNPVFGFLNALGWVIALGNLLAYGYWMSKLTDFLMMLDVLLMFGMGVYVMRRGYPPARYFMLAWSFFLVSVFVAALHNAGLVPGNPLIDLAVVIGIALQVTLLSIGLGARFEQIRQEKEMAQQQLINQLQENDRVRNRIARDLHDDIGSTLSSISILSQVAQRHYNLQEEGIPELLGRISKSAQKMLDTMSDIVWTTKPDNDSMAQVATRMREFAAEILESQDIHYSIDVAPEVMPLKIPTNRHYDFYLIFKEAINNAAKYSGATLVSVHVSRQRESLLLVVHDNGRGFDIAAAQHSGNGLKNMQQRAAKIEAELSMQSEAGQGTTLWLRCPLT